MGQGPDNTASPTLGPAGPVHVAAANYPVWESANLDFLRSIAVLLVFIAHYFDIRYGLGTKGSFLWRMGRLGVLIFFVHTALVLMWSLERSGERGAKLFAPFYVRRAMRLYPLSIVCVLFAYIFDTRWVPANLWPNLTLTQYLFLHRGVVGVPPLVTPLWSLPLEVEMYVVLPVLFLLLRNRPIRLLAIVWGVAVAIACVQPRLGDRFIILEYVPCFLGGVMAWRVMRGADRRRIPAWLWPLAIAMISAIWMDAPEERGALFESAFVWDSPSLCSGKFSRV